MTALRTFVCEPPKFMRKLYLGDQAPNFELKNQDGEDVRLSDYIGKNNVVLFFYPKDETPGCIKEVCGFRDRYEEFVKANAVVIGVSADSVDSHKLFKINRRLPYQLLSDPKNKTRKEFDVSGSMFGLLPGRETFVIDKEGIIQLRFSSQFQIEQHIEEALKTLKKLQ